MQGKETTEATKREGARVARLLGVPVIGAVSGGVLQVRTLGQSFRMGLGGCDVTVRRAKD